MNFKTQVLYGGVGGGGGGVQGVALPPPPPPSLPYTVHSGSRLDDSVTVYNILYEF